MSGNPHFPTVAHCAGPNCEAVRKEANHWFLAGETDDLIGGQQAFYCVPLTDVQEISIDEKPVCGQVCAHKVFEAWMARASMNPTTKEEPIAIPAGGGVVP